MTSKIGNLVQQSSITIGAGNLVLVSLSGKRSFFDQFGTGGTDRFYYFISHRTANEWELGTGHLLNSTTIVRDTVIQSSNANTFVVFSIGTKDVLNELPAQIQSLLEKAWVYNEVPFGVQNGINVVFTTAFNFESGKTRLFLNGLRLFLGSGNDYTETAPDEITLNQAPESNDILLIDYRQE